MPRPRAVGRDRSASAKKPHPPSTSSTATSNSCASARLTVSQYSPCKTKTTARRNPDQLQKGQVSPAPPPGQQAARSSGARHPPRVQAAAGRFRTATPPAPAPPRAARRAPWLPPRPEHCANGSFTDPGPSRPPPRPSPRRYRRATARPFQARRHAPQRTGGTSGDSREPRASALPGRSHDELTRFVGATTLS